MNLSNEDYKSIIANSLAIAQHQGRVGLSLSDISKETNQKRQFLKVASSELKRESVIDHKYDGGIPVLTFVGEQSYLDDHPMPEGFSFIDGGFLSEASKSLKSKVVKANSQADAKPQVDAKPLVDTKNGALIELAKDVIDYISKNRNEDNNYFYADQFLKDSAKKSYSMTDLLNVCSAFVTKGYLTEDDLLSELQDANLFTVEDEFDEIVKLSDSELSSIVSIQENAAQSKLRSSSPVGKEKVVSSPAASPASSQIKEELKRDTLSIPVKKAANHKVNLDEYLKPLYKLDISKVDGMKRKEKRDTSCAIIRQALAEKGQSLNKSNLYELTKPVLNVSMPTFSGYIDELVEKGMIQTTKAKARVMYLIEGERTDIGLLKKIEDLKLPKEERKFSTVLDWSFDSKAVTEADQTNLDNSVESDTSNGKYQQANDHNTQEVQTKNKGKIDPLEAFGSKFVFEAFPTSETDTPTEESFSVRDISQKKDEIKEVASETISQTGESIDANKGTLSDEASHQLKALIAEVMGSIEQLNNSSQAESIGRDVSDSISRLISYAVEREGECKKWRNATAQFLTNVK